MRWALGKGRALGQLKPLKGMAAILNSPTSWTRRTKVVAHAMPAISAERGRCYIGCVLLATTVYHDDDHSDDGDDIAHNNHGNDV